MEENAEEVEAIVYRQSTGADEHPDMRMLPLGLTKPYLVYRYPNTNTANVCTATQAKANLLIHSLIQSYALEPFFSWLSLLLLWL